MALPGSAPNLGSGRPGISIARSAARQTSPPQRGGLSQTYADPAGPAAPRSGARQPRSGRLGYGDDLRFETFLEAFGAPFLADAVLLVAAEREIDAALKPPLTPIAPVRMRLAMRLALSTSPEITPPDRP
jgi:hypothetical protein